MPSNLYDSLLERMEGKPYSNYFAAFCPWDEHKAPALLVFEDGMVKCLSCNKIWNHQQLDKKIGSHFIPQRFDTVSRVLPRWRTWERKYGSLEGIAHAAHKNVNVTYLKRRKIYEFKDEGCLGSLDGWITFPVFDRTGKIINIVVRSTNLRNDVRYVVRPSESDGIHYLYTPSWKRLNESETIYCVFGIIDSISLCLSGFASVTGLSGKSLSPEPLRLLNKKIVIVPDSGEEREAHKLANSLGWRASVKEISFPEGTKDPDDIRRIYGNDKLIEVLV